MNDELIQAPVADGEAFLLRCFASNPETLMTPAWAVVVITPARACRLVSLCRSVTTLAVHHLAEWDPSPRFFHSGWNAQDEGEPLAFDRELSTDDEMPAGNPIESDLEQALCYLDGVRFFARARNVDVNWDTAMIPLSTLLEIAENARGVGTVVPRPGA